jgi:hypothetical protein
MSTISRRLLAGAIVIATLYAVTPAASAVARHHTVAAKTAIPPDGFAITHVPGGAGPLESEFAYEWEDSRAAASAVIDRERFSDTELRRTARGFQPAHGPVGG